MKDNINISESDLDVLLDLDGFRHYNREDGYWVKIDAKKINPTKERPHGLKYSLTLHDRNGTRIIGYDNAHYIKDRSQRKKYKGRRIVYDHKHELEKMYPYDFESPGQLLEDFWADVGKIAKII